MDYALDPSENPMTEPQHIIFQLRLKIEALEEENYAYASENSILKIRVKDLEKTVESFLEGNLPESTKETVVREQLKDKFYTEQIDFFVNKDRKGTKNWSQELLCDTMKLRNNSLSGFKKVKEVFSKSLPLPSLSKLHKTYNFLSLKPGINTHMLTYFKHHLSHTESWRNGNGNLAVIKFDEVSTGKDGMYDNKNDMVVGKPTVFKCFCQNGFSKSISQ